MTHRWEDVLLEEVSDDITVGYVGPMADQYIQAGIPFLRSLNVDPFRVNTNDIKYISNDFHRRISKSSLRPGDVVIVRTGKPGACAVIPDWLENANCSDLVVVRAGNKVRPSYLCYVINSSASHHIDAYTVGAVQQHFNVGSARKIRFRLPSIAEQDRILSVLGALDDKIDLNQRMNETLEAMARAIFKDWFVDFGPVRAKAEGRPPYLAPELWSLFPDAFDDEDKPAGWGERRIGDILELRYGKALTATKRIDGEVPVYGSGGITGHHNTGLHNGPSVVVGRKGTVGSLYWIDGSFYPIDTVFFVVSRIWMTYCFYMLETLGLDGMNTDAAVPGLNRENVYRLTVPWSSDAVRSAFDAQVMPLRAKMLSNKDEIATLIQLRNLLLPKLMSGEIRLRDAEKAVEAVA